MRRAALLTCTMIASGSAAASEQIGAWTLVCADSEPCQLRLSKRFLDKAGITGDLEVQASGELLVPVLALRGLPPQVLIAAAVMAGTTRASIQLNNTAREDLVCSSTLTVFVCAPQDANAAVLAAALPVARTAMVRISVAIAGMPALPEQERSMDLSGTKQALTRLRTPTQIPAVSTDGFSAMADRLLKAAGYPNGLAGLLAKYRGK